MAPWSCQPALVLLILQSLMVASLLSASSLQEQAKRKSLPMICTSSLVSSMPMSTSTSLGVPNGTVSRRVRVLWRQAVQRRFLTCPSTLIRRRSMRPVSTSNLLLLGLHRSPISPCGVAWCQEISIPWTNSLLVASSASKPLCPIAASPISPLLTILPSTKAWPVQLVLGASSRYMQRMIRLLGPWLNVLWPRGARAYAITLPRVLLLLS